MTDPLHLRTVLKKYYADKNWRFSETAISYDELEWFDQSAKPTPAQVNEQYQEYVSNLWKTEHVAVRSSEYPTTDELIVALWEKLVETDGLTSAKITEIQNKRNAVKEKYPKLVDGPRQTPNIPINNDPTNPSA
jgi:hypothetical protein